jgi:integrase-like protein
MAGLLHGSARTTPRVRAELQASQEATGVLAARYGLNPKTVQKWRQRTTTADQPMGPKRPRSTVLTEAEEAIVVAFRRRTLLPLDDVLGCLRESIPKLTRPDHPWTNGQAERMNRTVKDATIKVFHDPDLESLKAHILALVTAYNFGQHLKRLRWRTPFQAICEAWAKDPAPLKINPHHLIPGPYT